MRHTVHPIELFLDKRSEVTCQVSEQMFVKVIVLTNLQYYILTTCFECHCCITVLFCNSSSSVFDKNMTK